MFAAQVIFAMAVGVLVSALAPGTVRPNDFLGWVLVALALMQVPLAVGVAARLGSIGSRQAALSRALLAAVVLAGTAWFAALAIVTGQQGFSVYLLVALVAGAYGLGFITIGRLARAAATLPPDRKPAGHESADGGVSEEITSDDEPADGR